MTAKRFHAGFLLLLMAGSVNSARAENEGLEELDRATQLQLNVRSLKDVDEVISLCETALRKGLDEDNTAFAKQLLVGSLWQHASQLSAAIFDGPRPHPQWAAIREMIMKDLEKLLGHDADFADAYVLKSRLLGLPGGDSQQALEAVTRAIELFGEDKVKQAEALILRSELRENPEERLADLNAAVEKNPTAAEVWQARAAYYIEQNQVERAVEDFQQLLERDEQNVAVHQALAEALIGLDRNDLAQAHIEKAMELDPQSPLNFMLRARLRYLLEDLDGAQADADRTLELQPGLVQGILLRSMIAAADGRYQDAITDLQRVVRENPTNLDLQLQLASFYVADQRPRKAIGLLSALIQADADNADALRTRADALLSIGKHAEAIQDYEAALKLDPEDDGILNNLAWVLATSPVDELRNGSRSIELATKACELTAYEKPHILSTLAAGFAESGNFEKAIEWSTKAVEQGRETLKEQIEQLEMELKSYEDGKPWRELQEVEEKPDPPRRVIET